MALWLSGISAHLYGGVMARARMWTAEEDRHAVRWLEAACRRSSRSARRVLYRAEWLTRGGRPGDSRRDWTEREDLAMMGALGAVAERIGRSELAVVHRLEYLMERVRVLDGRPDWRTPHVRPTARDAVIAWIRREGGEDGVVVVTTERLAQEVGCCQQHLKRTLHELRQSGRLESGPTWTANGASGPNWYRVI